MFEIIPDRPDASGRFGEFGGCYVPEVLVTVTDDLLMAYSAARADPEFVRSYKNLLRDVVGRPSPLTFAKRLSAAWGAPIYLKREDLNHTGAHKINNTLGQALLCERMGKRRIIAETGAGQHGVATATACALFGFECVIYMGAEDVRRQALNVERMRLLGAEVRAVHSGTKTLKDAMNEAMRDWVSNAHDTYYLVGSAAGPHPYPMLVRDLQMVIGEEARTQIQTQSGALPKSIVACVGGGSNAIGLFAAFINDPKSEVALYGVEAAGQGLDTKQHSASIQRGKLGVLHGARTLVLQHDEGQIAGAHSIAPGLDYPGVGPEHCYLHAMRRASYVSVDDHEALSALEELAEREGILCALESAHAVAYAKTLAKEQPKQPILVGLSGRGDKDTAEISKIREERQA